MQFLSTLRHRLRYRMLSPVTRAVVQDRLTYLSLEKLERIAAAMKATAGVPGDILEFGVALGGSGIILASQARDDRRFFGFDVFGMIPPPVSEKDDSKSKERFEVIKAGQSHGIAGDEYYGYRSDLFGDVKAAFQRHGCPVDGKSVQLCKGLFEESWPTVDVDAIALVHVDCDWYDPVRYCLRACAGKLSRGGIIIIDDYHDYGGCRTAVDEFIASRSDFVLDQGRNPFLRKR